MFYLKAVVYLTILCSLSNLIEGKVNYPENETEGHIQGKQPSQQSPFPGSIAEVANGFAVEVLQTTLSKCTAKQLVEKGVELVAQTTYVVAEVRRIVENTLYQAKQCLHEFWRAPACLIQLLKTQGKLLVFGLNTYFSNIVQVLREIFSGCS